MKSTHQALSSRALAIPARLPSKPTSTGEHTSDASTSNDEQDDCTAFQTSDLQRSLPKVRRNPPRRVGRTSAHVKPQRRSRCPAHRAHPRVERRHATRLSRSPLTDSQRQRLRPMERRNATTGQAPLLPPRGVGHPSKSVARGSFRSHGGSFRLPRRPGQVLHPNDVQALQTFRQSF